MKVGSLEKKISSLMKEINLFRRNWEEAAKCETTGIIALSERTAPESS